MSNENKKIDMLEFVTKWAESEKIDSYRKKRDKREMMISALNFDKDLKEKRK